MLIRIVEHIDLGEAPAYLGSEETGAINLFVGTVRNHSKGKKVLHLDFEAYEPMAYKEMEKLGVQAKAKWPLYEVAIIHAVGHKLPGEPVVVIGVSSAHRDASFEACRWLIDELKKTVPIWKKEFYEDNSVWVNAHP